MLKRVTILGMLVAFVGLMTLANAGENPVRLVGNLTKVDGKNLTITADGGQNTVVTCNDATKFRRDEDNATLKFEDIKVGLRLRVYYSKADNVATLVNVAKPDSH